MRSWAIESLVKIQYRLVSSKKSINRHPNGGGVTVGGTLITVEVLSALIRLNMVTCQGRQLWTWGVSRPTR